jgi:hypothetical protein
MRPSEVPWDALLLPDYICDSIFIAKKILRPNIGVCFRLKSAQTPHQCLSYKNYFVGSTERSDLRRMRNIATHPAGFALLSSPYELR